MVASRKSQFGCPSGGRYSEEKGGSPKANGYGARTGTRSRTRPTIERNFANTYNNLFYMFLLEESASSNVPSGVAVVSLWMVKRESRTRASLAKQENKNSHVR
mmetsp:Transcript_13956/g.35075  ORF Transcript_13956/g.35075 Transcript_13956/m.35075 type:complete len:103 (-) Transcript_13956:189-497(-)